MIWQNTRTKSNYGKKRFISSYSSKRDAVHKGWESSVYIREPKWGIVIIWTTTEGLWHSEWKEASSFHHNCICMLTLKSYECRNISASITTWSSVTCTHQSGTGPSKPCPCFKWIQDTEFALSTLKAVWLLPNDFWISLLNLRPRYSKSPGKLSQESMWLGNMNSRVNVSLVFSW